MINFKKSFLFIFAFSVLLGFNTQAQVVSVSPAQNALNISADTSIQVTFNTAMMTSSFNDTSSFLVYGHTSGQYRGTFTFSSGNTVMTFTPNKEFKHSDAMTVNITRKVKTALGDSIAPIIFEFTISSSLSTGTFSQKVGYSTYLPFALSLNDYDNDNYSDIFVTRYMDAGPITILRNNNDGTFPSSVTVGANKRIGNICISDVDNDGDGDIILSGISILKNNGDGTFQSNSDYRGLDPSGALDAYDLDGNGYTDIAHTGYPSGNIGIFENIGDGTFPNYVQYPTGGTACALSIADVDNDGDGDIINANANINTISVLFNNGVRIFNTRADYSSGGLYPGFTISTGDLNGDGYVDIIVPNSGIGNGNVAILMNNRDGTFASAITYSVEGTPVGAYLGDLNGDSDLDVIVCNQSGTIAVFKNDGNGVLGSKISINIGPKLRRVSLGDLDNDGDEDIVVASEDDSRIYVLKNIASDIAVLSTMSSGVSVSLSYQVAVSSTVRNNSPASKTFSILAQIDTITSSFNTPLFSETQIVSALGSSETRSVSFGNWTATNNGQYKLRVISQLAGDEDQSNDTLITNLTVLVPTQPLLVVYENESQGGTTVKTALTNKGYFYNSFQKSGDVAFSLSNWQRVVWVEGQDLGISNTNADSLIAFLNRGGRILLLGNQLANSQSGYDAATSQAILFRQKLGINWISNTASGLTVDGITGDSVGNGITLTLGIGSGSKEKTTRTGNYVVLDSILTYSVGGNAGWKRDGGNYKIVYGGFPIQNATTTAMREQFIDQALRWFLLSSELGKISGQVFEDLNGNGNKDGGEPGIAGWTVSLSNRVTASTITDDGGNYVFNGLPSGQYTVSQTLKSGWQQSAPPGGTYAVALSVGDTTSGLGKDFGNFRPNSITIRKYEDRDGNFSTTNDRVLRSWNLRLYRDSISTMTLDSSAISSTTLIVTDLNPGKYIVTEADSIGWIHLGKVVNGSPILTSAATDTFILESNQTRVVDFINFHPRVSIRKYVDSDGDFLTTGDRSAKKWNLTLYSNSISPVNIVSQVSSAESLEVFDLPSGIYIAVEADSIGWTHIGKIRNGTPMSGTANADTFTYTSGHLLQIDFVNFNPNTITIRKFHDIDGNFGTTNDRILKKWKLTLYRTSISTENIVQTVPSAESLVVTNIGNGTYIGVEADSNAWYHIGKIRNGISQQGIFSADTFTVTGGQNIVLDFINKLSTITVRKFKDNDGNFNTVNDRSFKRWNLVLYRNLVNPDSIVASVSSAESLVVRNPSPAIYIAREADSTGWTHLGTIIDGGAGNLSSEREIQFVQSGNESHTTDFINTSLNEITVSNFLDQDGDFRTTEGSTRNWSLKLYRIIGSDTTIIDSVNSAPSFTKTNLQEGSYMAVEADSSFPWTHIGTELYTNGSLDSRLGGTQNKISFSLSSGQSKHARFLNFNRNRVKVWTAIENCVWSNGYNWDPPGIPIPGDSIVVPDTARCPLVIPAGSSVGTIVVAAQETVYISPGNFVSNGDVTVNGTMIADAGDTSLITVSGDWTVHSFSAGQSKVVFTGLTSQKIEGNGNTFYKLKIADGATIDIQTDGSFSVQENLYLGGNIDAAGDTIRILNSSINSVIGSGKILRGTLKRTIGQGTTSSYRFESAQSYLQFNGSGTYPTEVAMTVYPNALPTSFGDDWVEVPSEVDTVNNTVIAYGVNEFSKWVFGIPRPKKATSFLNRVYAIAVKDGMGYSCMLKLRYDQSELPVGIREDSLKLMKLPDETGRTFVAGWNLISLPLIPENREKVNIFPRAISDAYSYEGHYVSQDMLTGGIGYWLKFSASDSLEVAGSYITAETIAVSTGWNLVGSISTPISVQSITCESGTMMISNFFGYNTSYFPTDTVYPGYGYWVKVSQDGQLILSSEPQMLNKARIKIVSTSELPPPPPSEQGTISVSLPTQYALENAYPNPFNPITTLKYALPNESKVKLTIFNVLGQVVQTFSDGIESAGYKSLDWNASSIASGIYFYRLDATSTDNSSKSFTQVKKMILMK